jgi:hypothetical protein
MARACTTHKLLGARGARGAPGGERDGYPLGVEPPRKKARSKGSARGRAHSQMVNQALESGEREEHSRLAKSIIPVSFLHSRRRPPPSPEP